jgi:hypothetical protein
MSLPVRGIILEHMCEFVKGQKKSRCPERKVVLGVAIHDQAGAERSIFGFTLYAVAQGWVYTLARKSCQEMAL